ncbi:MAG: DUF1579 family protein [Planctomycetota bacterium]
MMCCLHGKSGLAAAMGLAAGLAFGAGTLVGASEVQPEMEQMDAEAMMQAHAQANKMTEHHGHMKAMVGVWDGHLTAEMPGGEKFESHGTMTNELIMDGRFLRGTWEGEMMGEPYSGVSIMGYSSVEGEYQGVWIDSTANQISYTTGGLVDDNTLAMHGEETNPASGMTMRYRDILHQKDDDHSSFTRMYITPMGEVEGFKIEYTRRK